MPRMFVEGEIAYNESHRMAAHRLMKALDEEAAKAGHRVTGDVAIGEYPPATFGTVTMRLEADVIPAV